MVIPMIKKNQKRCLSEQTISKMKKIALVYLVTNFIFQVSFAQTWEQMQDAYSKYLKKGEYGSEINEAKGMLEISLKNDVNYFESQACHKTCMSDA